MKKLTVILSLLCCLFGQSRVSAAGYAPVYFSADGFGYVTVRWDRVPNDLYYVVKVTGALTEEHSVEKISGGVCALDGRLRPGESISVQVYAVATGLNMVVVAQGSYTWGSGSSTGMCPKKLGTVSASFNYYYDLQQHRWAAMVYVYHTLAEGPEDGKHLGFRIFVYRGDGAFVTNAYCSFGSGYAYLSDPRGEYSVKIIADGCQGGGSSEGHYLTGNFYITREVTDQAGITLTEHNE